ncbi:MAG TPA: MarR family transcriptional regulator [Rhodoglobus sp.]|nr:MarR family transcriptional regulator [Rhodoglobus sp.]
MKRSDILETLAVATHRLTRHAAQSTGSPIISATWTALAVLEAEGPHRLGDLARAARISQPGMTKVVQNLVTDEWVYRIADVDDSRAWLIAITPKGERALASWRRQLVDALAPSFEQLSDDDWSALERTAGILASRSGAAAEATVA